GRGRRAAGAVDRRAAVRRGAEYLVGAVFERYERRRASEELVADAAQPARDERERPAAVARRVGVVEQDRSRHAEIRIGSGIREVLGEAGREAGVADHQGIEAAELEQRGKS